MSSAVTHAASGPMLQRLLDLNLPLTVVLGRATMPIRNALKLTCGSVFDLDRKVGEPVELLVHGTVVARGDIVSIKGNYGIRIREILSQEDRLSLRKPN